MWPARSQEVWGVSLQARCLQGVTKTELKALRNLDLKQQLLFVESYLPDAYEYLTDTANSKLKLPKYDDNDELVSWGLAPQDSPQDTPQNKEEAENG